MRNYTEISPDKYIKITWGVVAAIIGAVFVVGGWAVSQEMTTKENSSSIVKLQSQNEMVQEKLESIDNKVTRIETLMEYMHKQRGK